MAEYVSISTAAHKINSGDVLLFRAGCSFLSRIIAGSGRGNWCHAGVAAWWQGDLFCLEVREWYGGRAVLLEREVARRPGLIEVYRLTSAIDPCFAIDTNGLVRQMRLFAGASYGYFSVLRTALYHLPVMRCLLKPMTDDQMDNGRPPYCSQAVSYACRHGLDIDLVPNSADCMTEPADLARSAALQYQFTLRP